MKTGISLIFAAALLAMAACSGSEPANQTAANANRSAATTPSPNTAPSVDALASGRKLYKDNCAGCHRETGKGGPIEIEGKRIDPEDLTAEKIKKMPDDKIYRYVHGGIEDEGMPAFKDKLSEAQIREVVRYVRAELQGMPQSDPAQSPGVD